MDLLKKRKEQPAKTSQARTTTIAFTGDDLATIGRLLSIGQSVLPTKHPIFARIKAAMTRMNVPTPKGL